MGTGAKLGLVAALIVVVVGGFVVFAPADSGDDSDGTKSTNVSGVTPESKPRAGDAPTATAESAKPPPPTELAIADHEVKGGVQTIKARKGDVVRFKVSSDTPDEIHLHGYDIEKPVEPGKPASFRLQADIEGEFEIEGHEAERAGKDPLIAKLVVEPS